MGKKGRFLLIIIFLLIATTIAFYFILFRKAEREGLVISEKWFQTNTSKGGYLVFRDSNVIVPVQYKIIDSMAVFQGDIILGTESEMQLLVERTATQFQPEILALVQPHLKWINNTVIYELDDELDDYSKSQVLAAFEAFRPTRIRFQQKRDADQNYVYITKNDGYGSAVGMQQSKQDLYIRENPVIEKIIHELGHAIGLWHEHSRPDRDQYIRVNYSNIDLSDSSQFAIVRTNATTLNTTYDCNSIMHYNATDFAKQGLSISRRECATVGGATTLSTTDISAINELYK